MGSIAVGVGRRSWCSCVFAQRVHHGLMVLIAQKRDRSARLGLLFGTAPRGVVFRRRSWARRICGGASSSADSTLALDRSRARIRGVVGDRRLAVLRLRGITSRSGRWPSGTSPWSSLRGDRLHRRPSGFGTFRAALRRSPVDGDMPRISRLAAGGRVRRHRLRHSQQFADGRCARSPRAKRRRRHGRRSAHAQARSVCPLGHVCRPLAAVRVLCRLHFALSSRSTNRSISSSWSCGAGHDARTDHRSALYSVISSALTQLASVIFPLSAKVRRPRCRSSRSRILICVIRFLPAA